MTEAKQNPTPFHTLTQDTVIDAIESLGFLCDLRVFPLNSYENRVYQVGIEDSAPLIAKFYRPNRWSHAQIKEEHAYCKALIDLEIPILSPIERDGETLFFYGDHMFSLFTRFGGHAPNLDDLDTTYRMGQQIGRIHAVGATQEFAHRPTMDMQSYVLNSQQYLLENDFLPTTLRPAYQAISDQLIATLTPIFEGTPFTPIRLHGDCHPGNILERDELLYFVDFDDCRSGPAIQDMWMLLNGERSQKQIQLGEFLDGYEEFHTFNNRELHLIETLRTMRLMHYSAWLARRWQDPAFPFAFPWFNTERYWAEHILELKEQASALNEPALIRL